MDRRKVDHGKNDFFNRRTVSIDINHYSNQVTMPPKLVMRDGGDKE